MCYEERKSVEFNEEELGDIESLKNRLFNEEKDPRSYSYKRILCRPKIVWPKIIAYLFILIASALIVFFLIRSFSKSTVLATIIAGLFMILFIAFDFKRIFCTCIKIYQRYAPNSLRNKCRFEPSCSEYMVLAVEKYGVCKGIRRGIGRLRRCNINNGGFDYP